MLGKLSDKQIDELLQQEVTARLGCYARGKLYVVPITYVFDGENLICHTREGMKVDMMRQNPEVCVEVDRMEDMANWQSVIAWGTYEELKDQQAEDAMQVLLERLLPLLTSETAHPFDPGNSQERRETRGFNGIIYRIRLKEKTGRFEKR